jgi:hypothetical protein
MAEQDRLQLLGQTFASLADTESARFARELSRVLAVLERDLVGLVAGVREGRRGVLSKVGRLLTLRKEIREALTRAGYSALATRTSLDVVERMAMAAQSSAIVRESAALGQVTAARLKTLAGLMREDLLGVGETLAHQVWRSAVFSIYTDRPVKDVVSDLAKAIEKSRAQAQTLFDTQVSIVGRQVVAQEPKTGDDAYLYVGPVDGVVRPWCREQLGMVRSKAAIDALDNGQLPNAFVTAGGYNCRHSWMAVSEPELLALKDTGTRAPGYEERLGATRPVKRAQRRAA